VIAFSGSPLDRAETLRRDPAAVAALSHRPDARWLVFDAKLRPAMLGPGGAGGIAWSAQQPAGAEPVLLGLAPDGAPRFAAQGDPPSGSEAVDARSAAMAAPGPDLGIIAHARALLDWHATHRFCANCGAPTEPVRGGANRRCAGCRTEHYPRVNPVVIMLVIHPPSSRALLARGPHMPAGFLSALAGFMEPGETIEEAVGRETFEEVGVKIGRVVYHSSQPWPFQSNLMIGCFAEALTEDLRVDPDEIEEACWVTREELGRAFAGSGSFRLPPPLAIANQLTRAYFGACETVGIFDNLCHGV
jgi:NAD+ diphosphatase